MAPARLGVVVTVTFVDTSALLPGGSKATGFAVLVHRVDDPVDARVAADLQGMVNGPYKIALRRLLTALWLGSTRMTSKYL